MSAGNFINSIYVSDGGVNYNIRIQPETTFTENPPGPGPVTAEPSAIANGSRRGIGVNARRVRLVFKGTAPDGYKANSPISIPVLTPTNYNLFKKGDTVTYLGQAATVIGKTPEYVN